MTRRGNDRVVPLRRCCGQNCTDPHVKGDQTEGDGLFIIEDVAICLTAADLTGGGALGSGGCRSSTRNGRTSPYCRSAAQRTRWLPMTPVFERRRRTARR
jgi:hypothetical protein